MRDCILAVDGGGTRCRIALASSVGSIRIEVGSANVTTDFCGTVHRLVAGLEALAKKANLPLAELENVPAYFGLAGFQVPNDFVRLSRALPLKRVKIEDDRPAAVIGALGARSGGLIHSGTGSFFAVQNEKNIRFSGGGGAVLGDQGSAAWLGKHALAAVLEVDDGLREKTLLTRTLVERFESLPGILAFANDATPADFGELAPLIVEYANDPVSQGLFQKSADYFEQCLRRMGWSDDSPVCLTGGLAPHLAPYLTKAIRDQVTVPAGVPLDGAIALARNFAEQEQQTC